MGNCPISFVLGGQPSALLAPSENDGKMTGILNSSQYSLKRKRYAARLHRVASDARDAFSVAPIFCVTCVPSVTSITGGV